MITSDRTYLAIFFQEFCFDVHSSQTMRCHGPSDRVTGNLAGGVRWGMSYPIEAPIEQLSRISATFSNTKKTGVKVLVQAA
jgi:hypothetical protein